MFLIEFIGDLVVESWIYFMQLIVPEKMKDKSTVTVLKIIVGIVTCILLILMVLGIFAIISDEPYTRRIGRYIVLSSLGISAVQIIFGILVRVAAKKKE